MTVPGEDIDTLTGRMLREKGRLTGEATGPSFGRQGDADGSCWASEKSSSPACVGCTGRAHPTIGHRALDVPSDAPGQKSALTRGQSAGPGGAAA